MALFMLRILAILHRIIIENTNHTIVKEEMVMLQEQPIVTIDGLHHLRIAIVKRIVIVEAKNATIIAIEIITNHRNGNDPQAVIEVTVIVPTIMIAKDRIETRTIIDETGVMIERLLLHQEDPLREIVIIIVVDIDHQTKKFKHQKLLIGTLAGVLKVCLLPLF